jgi:hypothetical protein
LSKLVKTCQSASRRGQARKGPPREATSRPPPLVSRHVRTKRDTPRPLACRRASTPPPPCYNLQGLAPQTAHFPLIKVQLHSSAQQAAQAKRPTPGDEIAQPNSAVRTLGPWVRQYPLPLTHGPRVRSAELGCADSCPRVGLLPAEERGIRRSVGCWTAGLHSDQRLRSWPWPGATGARLAALFRNGVNGKCTLTLHPPPRVCSQPRLWRRAQLDESRGGV